MKRGYHDIHVDRWHRLFWASELSLEQFAREIGLSRKALAKAFEKHGLPTDKRRKHHPAP